MDALKLSCRIFYTLIWKVSATEISFPISAQKGSLAVLIKLLLRINSINVYLAVYD